MFTKCNDRQVRKFNQLGEKINRTDEKVNLRPAWLFNLSKKDLTEAQKNVLSKGPHFAKAPTSINSVDIAAPIESALLFSTAPQQVVESTRINICEAISRAKPPRKNVSKDEARAMKGFQQEKDTKILEADKGKATVILDAEDYDGKVHDLLDDGKSYSVLKKGPTKDNGEKDPHTS